LARGKRPVTPPAQAASAAPAAEYKLTAVSVLTTPTEYKNPFAPATPPAAPATAAAVETSTPVPAPMPAAEASATPTVPAGVAGAETAAEEPKPELKILPPEAPKRIEHNWESDSFRNVAMQPTEEQRQPTEEQRQPAEPLPAGPRPRREDRRGERPTFRPERERRDDRPAEPRPVWNEPGRAPGSEPSRTEFPSAPKAEAPKKSGGFFGWVKRLFGGSSAEAPKPEADTRGDREFGREGQYHRRRRRGGRGRNFHNDQRGPRDGQPDGQSSGESRGYGGEHRNHGGRRRRRHHGGGDYRGGGRPEGGPPQGS
jgi:hypothetical protein